MFKFKFYNPFENRNRMNVIMTACLPPPVWEGKSASLQGNHSKPSLLTKLVLLKVFF